LNNQLAVYLMLYLTGTMRLTLDPISGGNGRPLAFRAISSAAWSRVADPELPTSRADTTWPPRSIVRASRTVPCSPRARAASAPFEPRVSAARGGALVRGAGGSRVRFTTGFGISFTIFFGFGFAFGGVIRTTAGFGAEGSSGTAMGCGGSTSRAADYFDGSRPRQRGPGLVSGAAPRPFCRGSAMIAKRAAPGIRMAGQKGAAPRIDV
jgi:hypothetical protein